MEKMESRILSLCKTLFYAAGIVLIAGIDSQISPCVTQIKGVITDLDRTILVIGGAAGELRDSAKAWRAASTSSKEMSQQTLKVLQNSAQATEALTALIQHTDWQVNVKLIPVIADTINHNDATLTQLSADTEATVVALGKTAAQATAAMSQATQTLAQAGEVLGDPAIPSTLKHTDAASANIEQTTAHLANSSAMIEGKVREMTKPASFAKRVAEAVLTLAAPVVSIFK